MKKKNPRHCLDRYLKRKKIIKGVRITQYNDFMIFKYDPVSVDLRYYRILSFPIETLRSERGNSCRVFRRSSV